MTTDTDTNDGQTDDTGTSTNSNQDEAKTFTQEEVNTMMNKAKANVENKFTKKYEGVDINEYTELKTAQEAAARKEQIKKGEFEKILEEQASKHSIHMAILKMAAELGVEFAFPSTTVMIEQFPEKKGLDVQYNIDEKRIRQIIADTNKKK